MRDTRTPIWLKNRGYLHLGAKVNVKEHSSNIIRKVTDPKYVESHSFLPLIHERIVERRFKKVDLSSKKRSHSKIDKNGITSKNSKIRPLHYATHLDAIIFGYYAEMLLEKYEYLLKSDELLSDSIIAYRRIPTEESGNKSAIHFANEVFSEIKKRSLDGPVCIVKLDIKSFFSSIDHKILKQQWASLIGEKNLPNDHYNVYKAATRFSYILKDDLRINCTDRRPGYDEKALAKIRNKGVLAFYENVHDLKEAIRTKKIRICKFPFRNKEGVPMGIPQGLPISAVLANIYLYEFDKKIIETLVGPTRGYYRRYSDDIVFICTKENVESIKQFIHESIKDSKVEISEEKTEVFLFEPSHNSSKELTSYNISNGVPKLVPFTYLGFEFYGSKTLIKSTNLSKFYRRLVYAVKRKCKIAKKAFEKDPTRPPIVFKNQLYRLYSSYPLSRKKLFTSFKWLERNERGEYALRSKKIKKEQTSNYFSYVFRASKIMNEPRILRQLRNHKKIFNQAITKHLKK